MRQHLYHEQQRRRRESTDVLDSAAEQKVTIPLPLQATVYSAYEDRQSMVAGVILIIAGVFSIIITGLGIGLYNIFSFLAHGTWFGIVVSIT